MRLFIGVVATMCAVQCACAQSYPQPPIRLVARYPPDGADIVHVPYKGFGQPTQALLGGEVQLAFITLQAAKGMIKGGRVRVLALGEAQRSDAMPGVPALSELLPGFKKSPQWHAIMPPRLAA